ncbi:MAG: hypothetical protein AAFU77_04355 [Myxococcota bacterium]
MAVNPMGPENSGVNQFSMGGGTVTTKDVDGDGTIDQAAATGVGTFSTDGMVEFDEQMRTIFRNAGIEVNSTADGETLSLNEADLNATSRMGAVVAQMGSENDYADVQGQWADFISQTNYRGQVDVNALVQAVLREAYMQNTEDLKFYAQKVSMLNDLKEDIRDRLTELRSAMGELAGKDDEFKLTGDDRFSETMFDMTPVWNDETGKFEAAGEYLPEDKVANGVDTKGELEAYITNLEELLNSVGDDAQLANVDLQNMLQKQQQTLQMMSNISKMLHDTAMAVIRKMGG